VNGNDSITYKIRPLTALLSRHNSFLNTVACELNIWKWSENSKHAFQVCSGLSEQRKGTDLFSPEQDRNKITFLRYIYNPDPLTEEI
jgi:hypothetical protein